MPARARSEGERLLKFDVRSVWAPASLEGCMSVTLEWVWLVSWVLLFFLPAVAPVGFSDFSSLVGFSGVICLLLFVVWFTW